MKQTNLNSVLSNFAEITSPIESISELNLSTQFQLIAQFPKYISGAITSQSLAIKMLTLKERQELCYAASVSSFQRYTDARCHASVSSIHQKFNSLASKFSIKEYSLRSFELIQSRAIESNLVNRFCLGKDPLTNKPIRELLINLESLRKLIPSAFMKALDSAKNLFNSFFLANLRISGRDSETGSNALIQADLSRNETNETCGILASTESIDSRDQREIKSIKSNKGCAKDFYERVFKEDANEMAELDHKMREAKKYIPSAKFVVFKGADAKRKLELCTKHGFSLKESVKKFLKKVILDADAWLKTKTAESNAQLERQKAAMEKREAARIKEFERVETESLRSAEEQTSINRKNLSSIRANLKLSKTKNNLN